MTEENEKCMHCQSTVQYEDKKDDWGDGIPKKCTTCGFLPFTKVSQQPHGNQTLYCNLCQMYVKPCSFDGEDELCPYHQRVGHGEEGSYLMYDEFNQDGE